MPPSQSGFKPVELVMAIDQPDGSIWKIRVKESMSTVTKLLNGGHTLVTVEVDGDESLAINPAYVLAVQFRRPDPEVW